jgi:carbonic anhydrase
VFISVNRRLYVKGESLLPSLFFGKETNMKHNRVFGSLFLIVAGIFPALIVCQSSPAPVAVADPTCSQKPFTYDDGPLGQKHWCGTCNSRTARTQAPINIDTSGARPNGHLPMLDFSGYKSTTLVTTKNDHNLKVSYKDGQSYLSIRGKRYKLDEFHFHRPGEEAVDHHRPAMVIHLVHTSVEPGTPVAIAVMVEEGKPEPNTEALINKLIQNFPPPDGPRNGVEINATDLLPPEILRSSYYLYTGSLTTPGCDEPVIFYVLKTPVFFSKEQIKKFEERYQLPNARDLQRTRGRLVQQTIVK